jgi:hypothetical protein
MARTNAECTRCGRLFEVVDMVGTAMPNRGGNTAYMCRHCAEVNEWYHARNDKNRGVEKKNKVFVGHEYEVSFNDAYARNIMFEFGLIPTNDSSLHGRRTCEFVTGIQSGLNIASKMAATIETLVNGGHLEINDSCGTHFHVSIDSMKDADGNKTYMGYIARFYHSLFVPLCKVMQENPEKTEALFGRYFTGYAHTINTNSDASDRYNFINVTNNSNIEFRLNKFVSAKQMQNLMKMEVKMVETIVTNFCEHFNDTDFDRRRYPTRTAYRKHKADVTAKKLVKLYEKYTANI